MIRLFKVSAPSPCGSFFAAYLQSITIIAESEEDALEKAVKWQASNEAFEKGHKVHIDELPIDNLGIVDYCMESDY